MKMSDFPAAHSMDTYWFAIDADENVAVFDTGEAGALPLSTYKLRRQMGIYDVWDFIQYIPRDCIFQKKSSHWWISHIGNYSDILGRLGLFFYKHGEEWENWIPGPYLLEGQPEKPLKLAELPEDIQDLISWTWFDELRFQDADMIQPIEYSQCQTWELGIYPGWMDTKGQMHGNAEDM